VNQNIKHYDFGDVSTSKHVKRRQPFHSRYFFHKNAFTNVYYFSKRLLHLWSIWRGEDR